MSDSHSGADLKIYARLLSWVVPYWGAFLLSIVGFLLYSISNISFLQLISYIVDSLNGDDPLLKSSNTRYFHDLFGDDGALNRTIIPLAIVAIATLRGVGTFVGNYFINDVSTHLVHNLRCQLFDQLLRLPGRYFDQHAMGHLVAKVTYHVTQVTGAATDALRVIIREGFTVIGYLAFLLYLNWKLTLIFIAVAPLIALLVNYAGKRFRRISERIQHSMGDVTHVASEAVQGYRVVRIFGGRDYERARFTRVSNDNRRQTMKMVVTSAVSTPVIQLLVATALAGLVWLVLDPALTGGMSPGNIVVFITTGGLLAKPVRQLSEVNVAVQKGLAAAEDIFALFDEEVEKDTGHLQLDRVRGHIEFRDVSFAYSETGRTVLKNISFTVQPGETIALVGRSGSGKSTLASLIPRFYTPTSGSILVDGHPLESLVLSNLRHHIAIVTQQVTLFNDTVRKNIAYGSLEHASDAKIIEAARKAWAWEFISRLPQGLDTVVGDDGVMLSGGQRQRLAIARAFLKDAPILVLDEATSALDTESERKIQAALEGVARGRTTFVIAHRLSTIEHADRILVIDDGRIVEQGTHMELLAMDGHYTSLYRDDFANDDDVSMEVPVRNGEIVALPEKPTVRYWARDTGSILMRAWYGHAPWLYLLAPLGYVFQSVSRYRRWRIEQQDRIVRASVPVIVVGNINAGGTGKTPFVIWLARQLVSRGIRTGIVSRGYGGKGAEYPVLVEPETDPAIAGEEAVMTAVRTGCPVVVDPDRVRAVRCLEEQTACEVILSDDGLQHYFLGRDVEIAVVDGNRGLGNGLCLPAGPLRESPSRLKEVDFVIVNGPPREDLPVVAENMVLKPVALVNLATGERMNADASVTGPVVHGVAGIGDPSRFFDTLRDTGFHVHEHAFPDHHPFSASDLMFGDSLPVVMTEKDAVKCRLLNPDLIHQNFWYLEIDAELPSVLATSIISRAGLNVTPLRVVVSDKVRT